MTAEQRVERISRGVQEILERVEGLSGDVLYREPTPGEWPVMSTLAHLSELLPYWAQQAEDVARSPGMVFGRSLADAGRVGAIEQHGHDALDVVVPRVRAALEQCVATLRRIPAEAWTSSGQHIARGSMSVEQIVDTFLVNHVEEHAAQTEASLRTLRASAT
ncbi:MAG TPA: DinB family protein [Chloroflexota bacterium]